MSHILEVLTMDTETYPSLQCHILHSEHNSFNALKIPSVPPIHPSSCPHLLANIALLNVSIVLPFPECHTVRIIQNKTFSDWWHSLSNTSLKFLCIFLWPKNSFIFIIEYSIAWVYHSCFFVYVLKETWLLPSFHVTVWQKPLQ